MKEKRYNRIFKKIKDADHILIGAGAGLSAAAGHNYMDKKSFARNYPDMVRRGFQFKAQLMGIGLVEPAVHWAYYLANINEVRSQPEPYPVYSKLYDLVGNKDYFVLSSNVDALFERNGFKKDKIFTPQGDYAYYQCLKPCTREIWPIKPLMDKILAITDKENMKIPDEKLIPKCPNCGGDTFINARGGNWFIEEPYMGQKEVMNKWLDSIWNSQLLILDIGTGFNTPVVVRWPMEQITYNHPNAFLIRINLDHPEVHNKIKDKAIEIKKDAKDIIFSLWDQKNGI